MRAKLLQRTVQRVGLVAAVVQPQQAQRQVAAALQIKAMPEVRVILAPPMAAVAAAAVPVEWALMDRLTLAEPAVRQYQVPYLARRWLVRVAVVAVVLRLAKQAGRVAQAAAQVGQREAMALPGQQTRAVAAVPVDGKHLEPG